MPARDSLPHEGIAILVRVAPEILKLMKDGDAEPVVILGVDEQPDGTYDMTLAKPAIVEERDRYREALKEIGGNGGPLYRLEPSQGERPDPVMAARELRRIVTAAFREERP
jgi:hypothetical protein